MSIDDEMILAAASRIQRAENILITSHIRPDGDAIGSLIGLGLMLEEAGHKVQMVIDDGVPASLRHLEGSERIKRSPSHQIDLFITVDCSDLERCGSWNVEGLIPDINIDHHITNPMFGRVNLVDSEAAATAEILAQIIPQLELQLTPAAASALLTGIVTDTIGFRTPNVSPKTLRLAAALLETGVSLSNLYQKALVGRSFEFAKFWGSGLFRLEKTDRMIWTTLTLEDRKLAGYSGRDDADLINLLSSIDSADIALVFVEQPNGNIKISWRAQPGFDVAQLASEFGGGGHPAAAGAEVTGSLSEVQSTILTRTRSVIYGGNSV